MPLRSLARTTADLVRYGRRWQRLVEAAAAGPAAPPAGASARLREITGFGDNPGGLRMLAYLPGPSGAAPPLVVVLHGCLQTGAGYDHGTGWSALAERHGFAVLVPEQQARNNPNLCFNWFRSADQRIEAGEPASIRAMVGTMIDRFGIDPARVYVTGLSAGGAMAAVMLAVAPDLFAAGAVVAGLPYRAATDVRGALEAMAEGVARPPAALGDEVRSASRYAGPWPRLSVWHGEADAVVHPRNAEALLAQWADLHGLPVAPSLDTSAGGRRHRQWHRDGTVVLESHLLAGVGHGAPLDPSGGIGVPGPYFLDAGVSSTERIAAFFGLLAGPADRTGGGGPQQPEGPAGPGLGGFVARMLRASGLAK